MRRPTREWAQLDARCRPVVEAQRGGGTPIGQSPHDASEQRTAARNDRADSTRSGPASDDVAVKPDTRWARPPRPPRPLGGSEGRRYHAVRSQERSETTTGVPQNPLEVNHVPSLHSIPPGRVRPSPFRHPMPHRRPESLAAGGPTPTSMPTSTPTSMLTSTPTPRVTTGLLRRSLSPGVRPPSQSPTCQRPSRHSSEETGPAGTRPPLLYHLSSHTMVRRR